MNFMKLWTVGSIIGFFVNLLLIHTGLPMAILVFIGIMLIGFALKGTTNA